jgi:hypothetical protein
MILIGEDKRFYYYKGFGTIENPRKYVLNLSMEYDPVFDGKRQSPEEYIKSFDKVVNRTNESTRIAICDFSEPKSEFGGLEFDGLRGTISYKIK